MTTLEAFVGTPTRPPPPLAPVVVLQEAEASETTAGPVLEPQVGAEELCKATPVRTEYCPTVHPEPATVVESAPSLVEEALGSNPVFLLQDEPAAELEQEMPPRCADVTWVFPPCLHDRKRKYSDDLRRLQLIMKMPGSDWDVGVLARCRAWRNCLSAPQT